MIKQHIPRFDVSMHDPLRVSMLEPLEYLIDIQFDVVFGKHGVQGPELNILYVFHNDRGGLVRRVNYEI